MKVSPVTSNVRNATTALVWLAALLVSPHATGAQQTDSAATDTVRPAAPPAPKFDLSGVLFANYQYRTDRGAARAANKFDLERAYVTLRMPAGERASVRVTTDIFQQQQSGNDSYYRGWSVRAKYAYLQYDYLKRGTMRGAVRFGLIHNVFIEHDESFWPRWIATVATDRAGYFSSADAGIATSLALPANLGEVYATIVNGPGYTSRETDRFKDYAARLTVTPFAGHGDGFSQSLAVTAWTYRGATGSRFAGGGPGQVASVGSSLERTRWGLFAAAKNSLVTVAAQYAARTDAGESGSNTPASPRAVVDSAGSLVSGYVAVRPFVARRGFLSGLSLIGRLDRVTANRATEAGHRFVVGGMTVDLTKAAALSLDYQEQLPRGGGGPPANKTMFLHLVARF